MAETILTDENFKKEVIEFKSTPVLVDFWAPWCGPCQMIGPIVAEIADEMKNKIKVGKLNVDESPEIAGKYEIISIPSLKIFKDGEIVDEIIGLQPKEVIIEKIKQVLSV